MAGDGLFAGADQGWGGDRVEQGDVHAPVDGSVRWGVVVDDWFHVAAAFGPNPGWVGETARQQSHDRIRTRFGQIPVGGEAQRQNRAVVGVSETTTVPGVLLSASATRARTC
jgi:hypothetical protein